MGGMHAAVFFVDIADLKPAVLPLPFTYQLRGIIGGPVIHDQPDKILAVLGK